MRFLIVALLAFVVDATYDTYYGGYGSSLYGAGYGSGGFGYGSGGIGYGSGGISYVSGGSGRSWGHGGARGHSHYTSYRPASYQTAKYSYQQPDNTEIAYKEEYAAPENVAFTLGGTGYQTGATPAVNAHQTWNSPAAIPGSAGVVEHGTTSIHHGGVQGDAVPAKISFVQDFSGTSGAHRSGGNAGISSFKNFAPAQVVREKYYQRPQSSGATYTSGYSSGVVPGSISFTLGGTGYQTGGAGPTAISRHSSGFTGGVGSLHSTGGHIATGGVGGQILGTGFADAGYQKIATPVVATYQKPARISSHRATTLHHGGVQGVAAPAKISFTQDFSHLGGQSSLQRSGGVSGISAFKKPVAPVRLVTEKYQQPRISGAAYGSGHSSGVVPGSISFTLGGTGYQSGVSGASGYQKWQSPAAVTRPSYRTGSVHRSGVSSVSGQPRISFTQDFSKVTGQSGMTAVRPEIHGYNQVAAPVRTVVAPVRTVVAPVRTVVAPKPVSGSRMTSSWRQNTAGLSAVGPAKISFTQDFSKVAGPQTLGVKPVVSTLQKSTGGYQNTIYTHKPAPKLEFKVPKQPTYQQPAHTVVYEEPPVQEIFTGPVEKSSVVAAPISSGYQTVDYKQEITAVGDGYGVGKQANVIYIPGNEVKSSAYKQTVNYARFGGDAGYGQDQPAIVLHSSGVSPSGGLVGGRGASYQLSSGNIGSAISSYGNQGLGGYSTVSAPFKSYYTSSYPGYSQVSGETPAFDVSSDKSLVHTYSSPYLVSPFSYTYSSGKGQYDPQVYKKA